MLGVALGAIYSLEDAEVLSLLAIAQRLVRLPEKCQTFELKTDLADIISTNHYHLGLLAGFKRQKDKRIIYKF